MTKIPPMTFGTPSRASGERVRDRRDSVRTPIPTKSRTTRSARRALRSYHTAVTLRQHFLAPHKIIRLLNKRGLRSDGDGWSCAGCDSARVKSRCRTGRVPCWLGVGLRPIREYEGEIFTDYYFGEANTANKSVNQHNNAINENLNWGGISGLLQLATTNSGSRPEIQDGPGGRGKRGKCDEELNTTNKELDSMSNAELLTRNFRRETTTSKDEAIETSRGGTTVQTDDQGKHSYSKCENTRQKD